jgi:ABC-type glycerol-3-phosphate transport system substrate-binding protein
MPRFSAALLAAVAAMAAACGGPAQTDSAAPHSTSTTPIDIVAN